MELFRIAVFVGLVVLGSRALHRGMGQTDSWLRMSGALMALSAAALAFGLALYNGWLFERRLPFGVLLPAIALFLGAAVCEIVAAVRRSGPRHRVN